MSNWVLLRGLTRDSRHWGDFVGTFKEQLPDAKVVMLDFAGNGVFHRQRSAARIADMVDFCRSELTRQNIAPPYRLLAISLGGMVAVDWATRYSREIGACVLINTSMSRFSGLTQRLRPAIWPRLLRLLTWPMSAQQLEAQILRMTTNHAASQALAERWSEYRKAQPVSRSNALLQLAAAGRYRAPIHKPPCPMLMLASTQDKMVDVECSRVAAREWQVPLFEHPTAGHDLTVDDGLWVAQRVRECFAV